MGNKKRKFLSFLGVLVLLSGLSNPITSFATTSSGDDTVMSSADSSTTSSGDDTVMSSADSSTTSSGDDTVMSSADSSTTSSGDDTVMSGADSSTTSSGDDTITSSADSSATSSGDDTVTSSADSSTTSSGDDTTKAIAFPTKTSIVVNEPTFSVPFDNYKMKESEKKDWSINVASTKIATKADVVFVFDTTGSMKYKIPWVISSLNDFSKKMNDLGSTSINWGLYSFGDIHEKGEDAFEELKLGEHDLLTVSNSLSNMHSFNGGDGPEDSIYASMKAINNSPWREDAQKFVILLTDAEAKERPLTTIGGYSATADGLFKLVNELGIDWSVQTLRKIGSSVDLDSNEKDVYAITIDELASTMGKSNKTSKNSKELSGNLSLNLNELEEKEWTYSYKIEILYSDGTKSNDIMIDIQPEEFTLKGNQKGSFKIISEASKTPKKGETTTAVITYLVNGQPVNNGIGSTQTLVLVADEDNDTPTKNTDTPTKNTKSNATPLNVASDSNRLPKTGTLYSLTTSIIGVVVLNAGVCAIYMTRKKRNKI